MSSGGVTATWSRGVSDAGALSWSFKHDPLPHRRRDLAGVRPWLLLRRGWRVAAVSDADDLWHTGIAQRVHELFKEIPDVEPKEKTCWHGNIAAGCRACDRERVRNRKRRGEG